MTTAGPGGHLSEKHGYSVVVTGPHSFPARHPELDPLADGARPSVGAAGASPPRSRGRSGHGCGSLVSATGRRVASRDPRPSLLCPPAAQQGARHFARSGVRTLPEAIGAG